MNVCSSDLPEVEIISLLEEQLPVYRLRADTVYGYDHDDWLHTPLVSPDSALDLTAEQIEETLKYFLLCAERVGQMTKTYSDIDAVTRLLEEKERDLELAARIGQSLLKKNKKLSERNEVLEEQVEHIREEVSQLRHDLSMKEELLQFYTNAAEESDGESISSTPVCSHGDSSGPVSSGFPLESLQKKLKDLQEENISLRSEASHLETQTVCYEEKEQQLVHDCVKELRDTNVQMASLAEELAKKTDDASRQQEEITHLLSQIVSLQRKTKTYAVENEELNQHLGAAKQAQRQLTAELQDLGDKYAECMEMLQEAQEELKNLRNKTLPLSTPRRFHSLGLFPMDSLAAEIEGTMRKELQMDDPDVEEQKLHPKRVFQTVKNINLMRQQRSSLGPSPLNIPGSNQSSCLTSERSSRAATPHSNSIYGSETGRGLFMDSKTSILGNSDDGSEDSNRRALGAPATPGSKDLTAALRRLALRRENFLSERRFLDEERERKLACLVEGEGEDSGGRGTPTDSLLSLCTPPSLGGAWSPYCFSSRSFLPDKLQIVKPLEGSATLHAWQQLAQPHLGAMMDPRPGVVTKGFMTLEQDQQDVTWQLSQPEEDEGSPELSYSLSGESQDPSTRPTSPFSLCNSQINLDGDESQSEAAVPDGGGVQGGVVGGAGQTVVDSVPVVYPGKCLSQSTSTYTFTNCRILHPREQLLSVSPSPVVSPQVSRLSSSTSTPLGCSTPRRLSLSPAEALSLSPAESLSLAASSTNLRESTRTTSTSLGLVHLLLERGISASMYDPCSWDRGAEDRTSTGGSLTSDPFTPPHSPKVSSQSQHATSPLASPPLFSFGPSCDDPPYHDAFLASKPARTILREVRGELEREGSQADGEGQAEGSSLKLVDKLKHFGTMAPPGASNPAGGLLGPLGPAGGAVAGLGGSLPALSVGLRRNRSYPAMVGASMAMKDPGPPDPEILLPHTTHVTHTLQTIHSPNRTETEYTPEPIHSPNRTETEYTPEPIHSPNRTKTTHTPQPIHTPNRTKTTDTLHITKMTNMPHTLNTTHTVHSTHSTHTPLHMRNTDTTHTLAQLDQSKG